MLTDLVFRWRAIFRPRRAEDELTDELQFHLDHAIEKHMAAGMSRVEATRRAYLAFGGLEQAKECCRDARGVAFVETVLQDSPYGLRTTGRRRISSVTGIAALALSPL